MATHSSVLAWKIPATVEPDGLPSMGSHRVGHDWSDLAAARSVGEESACNAGDPGSIPGSGRCPGEGNGYPLQYLAWRIPWTVWSLGSQRVGHNWVTFTFPRLAGKESACNAGDQGSIPGLGRSPGGGHGNPRQYSCLENFMDREAWLGYNPWGPIESDTTEQLTHS